MNLTKDNSKTNSIIFLFVSMLLIPLIKKLNKSV